MGLSFFGLAAAGLAFGAGDLTDSSTGILIFGLMIVGVSALGVCAFMYVLSGKPSLTLYVDTVEVSTFFTTKRLHRYEVLHYSIHDQGFGIYEIILKPKHPSVKPIKISSVIKRDDVLNDWLESLPNHDRMEAEEANAELARDPELGASPKERMARVNNARRVVYWVNAFAIGAMAWTAFYPRPYIAAVSIVTMLPWIAIAMAAFWPHLFRIDSKSDFGRPLLIIPFLFPGFILAIRAIVDFNLLDWRMPIVVGMIASFGISIVAAFADRGTPVRIGPILLILLMMVPYGYGATIAVNRLLDRSTPQYFPATVQGKHSSSGQGATYSVTLNSWGPRDGPNTLDVARQFYDQLGTRMHVCVGAKQGALGIAYLWLEACPPNFDGSEPQGPIKASAVSRGVAAFWRGEYAEARAFLQDAIKAGNAEAQFTLGLIYWEGLGFPKNGKEAMRLFTLAAKQGHARALNVLGFSYEHGIGVSADIKKAVQWYRKAVKEREPRALNNLGILYSKGHGVPLDPSEARRLWREALDQGHAPAIHNLGIMYHQGEGVPRDSAEARRLWLEAAKQGHAPALNSLGIMHYHSQGVPRDLGEAERFWRKAADRGHAQAKTSLGTMYYQGKGVPRDSVEASKLWRSAAGQGHAPAMLNLSLLFHNGDGVERDYVQAYMWLELAAFRYAPGKERNRVIANLEDLASRMTSVEISKAKNMARSIIRKNNWQ